MNGLRKYSVSKLRGMMADAIVNGALSTVDSIQRELTRRAYEQVKEDPSGVAA